MLDWIAVKAVPVCFISSTITYGLWLFCQAVYRNWTPTDPAQCWSPAGECSVCAQSTGFVFLAALWRVGYFQFFTWALPVMCVYLCRWMCIHADGPAPGTVYWRCLWLMALWFEPHSHTSDWLGLTLLLLSLYPIMADVVTCVTAFLFSFFSRSFAKFLILKKSFQFQYHAAEPWIHLSFDLGLITENHEAVIYIYYTIIFIQLPATAPPCCKKVKGIIKHWANKWVTY